MSDSGIRRLGVALLYTTLSSALFVTSARTPIYHSAWFIKNQYESLECLEYIENGGLGKIIRTFGLPMDEEYLINEFNRRRNKPKSKGNKCQYRTLYSVAP